MTVKEKKAETQYPILDLIAERWSPVSFADRPVEKEKLQSLFEAARWAPSSYNEQPWQYIIAMKDNPTAFGKILGCLDEENQEWAQYAPVLGLGVIKSFYEKNGKPNRHAAHDLGLSSGTLLIQATALGLKVHQMAGILPPKAKDVFAIPEGFEVLTGIAIGYEGDASNLPSHLKERQFAKRTRKPAKEFVFQDKWGSATRLF